MATKKRQQKVYIGVKKNRFTVWDEAQDVKIFRSNYYYNNSTASRGARRYAKRMNYCAEFL